MLHLCQRKNLAAPSKPPASNPGETPSVLLAIPQRVRHLLEKSLLLLVLARPVLLIIADLNPSFSKAIVPHWS